MALIYHVLDDVSNAQRLLEMVKELNRELNVSLDGAVNLLHQMANNPPTDEQMKQLDLFTMCSKILEQVILLI